jgi:hypothetical protein
MNPQIRYKLTTKLLKACEQTRFAKELNGVLPNELTYKHCSLLAEAMDWEANTLARLFALPKFKPTDCLSVGAENKIIAFLGYASYQALEMDMMLEIVFEEFRAFYDSKKMGI